jgi:hypothetical protein
MIQPSGGSSRCRWIRVTTTSCAPSASPGSSRLLGTAAHARGVRPDRACAVPAAHGGCGQLMSNSLPSGSFHRYRVVVDALSAQDGDHAGTEIRQPPGLGVDSLPAGCDRDRPPAADVDVEVEPVLDGLAVRNHQDPDTRSSPIRIDDAVRAGSQFGPGNPDVAPQLVTAAARTARERVSPATGRQRSSSGAWVGYW